MAQGVFLMSSSIAAIQGLKYKKANPEIGLKQVLNGAPEVMKTGTGQ